MEVIEHTDLADRVAFYAEWLALTGTEPASPGADPYNRGAL